MNAGAAIIAGDTHRQRITYDSGLQVWVNWRPEVWTIRTGDGRSYELPQWGFLALGAGRGGDAETRVMTCLNGGRFADYAQCPEFLFADARTWVDMPYTGSMANIEPRLRSFEYLGGDRVRVSYEWIVCESIRPDLMCFVHGVNEQSQRPERTVFQQDHPLPKPTSAWQAGETIVDGPYELSIPSTHGSYDLRVGLYNQKMRLQMIGTDDGTGRFTAGDAPPPAGGWEGYGDHRRTPQGRPSGCPAAGLLGPHQPTGHLGRLRHTGHRWGGESRAWEGRLP